MWGEGIVWGSASPANPRMVTCELSRVGCCLRRRQQQISTCRSQEGGKSLSRAENDPRRLSQKVEKKIDTPNRQTPPPPPRLHRCSRSCGAAGHSPAAEDLCSALKSIIAMWTLHGAIFLRAFGQSEIIAGAFSANRLRPNICFGASKDSAPPEGGGGWGWNPPPRIPPLPPPPPP